MSINKSKTAFVTGGTGFLGINLIKQLVADGWDVTALHRPTSNLTHLKDIDIKFKMGCISDIDSLENVIPMNVDAVFHAAANTNFWSLKNNIQTKDNVDGTRNMVSAALKREAKRFIHTSSLAAYGLHDEPITEETISTAARSRVNYIRTKWLAEREVRAGIERGLDAVILNPCNIIGPYDYNNWSQLFIMINLNKIPGVPPGAGTFCHVHEVAKAHITAFEKAQCGSNYILGGTDATYGEMAHIIAKLLGKQKSPGTIPAFVLQIVGRSALWVSYVTRKEPSITPEKVCIVTNWNVARSDKAEKELGYKTVPLKPMLEECYSWMRTEGIIPA